MFVNTYLFGRVDLPVASIYGNKVLRVLAFTKVRAAAPYQSGWVHEGWLLVLRYGKYAIYESIEAALRGYRKAMHLYGDERRGEQAEMAAMRDDASQFVHDITDRSRISAAARANVESIVAGLGSTLAGDSNPNKAAARADLLAASSSVDRLGRDNRGRQRMLLAQSGLSLEKRVREIKSIRRSLAPWLAAVGVHYRDCVLALREAKGGLEFLLASADKRWQVRETVLPMCARLVDRVGILNVEPFLVCRDLTAGDLYEASAAMRKGAPKVVKRSLARALMGVRVGLAHVRLENIRVELELLVREYDDPGSDRLVVRELIDAQRDRLRRFLENLKELDDADMRVRTLGKVRDLVVGASASLGAGGGFFFSDRLEQAVALL